MARIDNLNYFLTDVADAIRSKTGETENINAVDFDTKIKNLPVASYSTIESSQAIVKDKSTTITFDKKVAAIFFYIVASRNCTGYYINLNSSFWKGLSLAKVPITPQCWYNMDSGYYAQTSKVDDYSVSIYINGWGGTMHYVAILED
jgi:hypothetical protein